MQKDFETRSAPLLIWFSLPLVVAALFILNLSIGSVYIPLEAIIDILGGGENEKNSWINIIWQFRIPKAITAVLAGSALGLSGLLMQTFFRNPLAGPFVLGISSGASLGVALIIMTTSLMGGLFRELTYNSWLVLLAATAGSFMVLLLVLAVSSKVRDNMTILIVGLMFGTATSALVGILQFFSSTEEIKIYLLWTFGSLGGLSWDELKVFSIVMAITLLLILYLIKPLNAYLLGESYAQSLGVNLKSSRLLIVTCASIFAGATTAFCGPIAFIGIAVPHFARIIFNTSDHKILIPGVIFSGAGILLFCDIIAQVPWSESILPINGITSLLGAPVIIWLILRKRNLQKIF